MNIFVNDLLPANCCRTCNNFLLNRLNHSKGWCLIKASRKTRFLVVYGHAICSEYLSKPCVENEKLSDEDKMKNYLMKIK